MKYDTKSFLVEAHSETREYNPHDIRYPYRPEPGKKLPGPIVGCSLEIEYKKRFDNRRVGLLKGIKLTRKGKKLLEGKLPLESGFLPLSSYRDVRNLLATGVRLFFVPPYTSSLCLFVPVIFDYVGAYLLAEFNQCGDGKYSHASKWVYRGTYLEYQPCYCGHPSCDNYLGEERTGSIEDVTKVYEVQTGKQIYSPCYNLPVAEEVEDVIEDLSIKLQEAYFDTPIKHPSTPGELASKFQLMYTRDNLINLRDGNYDPLFEELYRKLHHLSKAGLTQAIMNVYSEEGYISDRSSAFLADLAECYSMAPQNIDIEKITTSSDLSESQLNERLYKCLEVYVTEGLITPGTGQPPLYRHGYQGKSSLLTPPTPRIGFITKDNWLYEKQKGGSIVPLECYFVYSKKGIKPTHPYLFLCREISKNKEEIPYVGLVKNAVVGKLAAASTKIEVERMHFPDHGEDKSRFYQIGALPEGAEGIYKDILSPVSNLLTRITMLAKAELHMRQRIDMDGSYHCRAGIDSSISLRRGEKGYGSKLGDFREPRKGPILVVNDFLTNFPGDEHRVDYNKISRESDGSATELEGPTREYFVGLEAFTNSNLMPFQAFELIGVLKSHPNKIPIGSIKTIGDDVTNADLRNGKPIVRRLPRTKEECDYLTSLKKEVAKDDGEG